MKAPIKCVKCGAPIEIDPYKEFAKCLYCGTTNIFDNGKLSSKSNKVVDKFREYLPILKEKKVYIPLIAFSILFPIAVYKANYIDEFLVKECQIRTKLSNDGEFIAKKNYKKCLRNIKNEWSSTISKSCKNLKKYYEELPTKLKELRTNVDLEANAEKEYSSCMNGQWGGGGDGAVNFKQTQKDMCLELKEAIISTKKYKQKMAYRNWELGFSPLVRYFPKDIEMNESGKFSQKKCNKNLKKAPHLIFERNKRVFE